MPRFFFNAIDRASNNLIKDFEGVRFLSMHEARKEAISFARDIARHGFEELNQTWAVAVTDEAGIELLNVPLSEPRVGLRLRLARVHGFGCRSLAFLLKAGDKVHRACSPASAAAHTRIVAVRFAPDADAAEITQFLQAYKAAVVSGARSGGLVRLRIGTTGLRRKEVAEIVDRMGREEVVDFAAAMP
jgi:hypothetical protein